jgi:hypothetical protein
MIDCKPLPKEAQILKGENTTIALLVFPKKT